VAEAFYGGDLPLCGLHDVPKVHQMLESGREPMACWSACHRPIVIPCGTLVYREPQVATEDQIYPVDDPRLLAVPDGNGGSSIYPAFDLTRMP